MNNKQVIFKCFNFAFKNLLSKALDFSDVLHYTNNEANAFKSTYLENKCISKKEDSNERYVTSPEGQNG